MPEGPNGRYFTSTAVALNEIFKLIISFSFLIEERRRSEKTFCFRSLAHEIFGGDSWKLIIPAILYTLQNNLQYDRICYLNFC